MPTLAQMTDAVYRDLADEGKKVFSTLQVEDFIRGGIMDLNRVAPPETTDDIELTVDPDTGMVTSVYKYNTTVHLPYRVEVRRNADGYLWNLSDPDEGGDMNPVGGYTFIPTAAGGSIEFPLWWLRAFPAPTHTIRVVGYYERPLPAVSTTETGLSGVEQYSVRAYAKAAGYDLLSHDRSLFAQWQGQTNNTDVSPTQITGMAAGAKQEWDRQRGLIRVVRRSW